LRILPFPFFGMADFAANLLTSVKKQSKIKVLLEWCTVLLNDIYKL
jgi:hypothetical protein